MTARQSIPLPIIDSIDEGIQFLLNEMADWLGEAAESHYNVSWQGGHDEGTFLTSWEDYYRLTKESRVIRLAVKLRDSFLEWARSNMVHGYHKRQDAHHGTEHYIIFLNWLSKIDPGDRLTYNAIIDASHHIGNWIGGIPRWYDWDSKRFVSVYLGTEHTGNEGLNIVDHLRFVHLALIAYRISKEDQYLEWACQYGSEWAKAIVDGAQVPMYLDSGEDAGEDCQKALASFLGAAPKDFAKISRVECHVASGTPQLFIELWQRTENGLFSHAAKKLILSLMSELSDPYANPVGVLFSLYRRTFKDTSFDEQFLDAIGSCPRLCELQHAKLGIQTDMKWVDLRGIGRRKDMPGWYLIENNGKQHLCTSASPAALMLAYEITGEENYAIIAVTLALAKLKLARKVFTDGREHGCSSRSIAAICRGHGRNWGAGDVSSVLSNPLVSKIFHKM